ncbi:hypothetical protein B0H66DRAFT_630422 [Apodospora peruviana]|uniref:C2H2-type domain-containing protein n=1 Tax=Apodospora peruviana TaxID=516989 RepID=A0AAE0M013_9PEZI|nr:hypothetical protein B0H66DRAFT_630422 [Apodospora peruviana]
MSSYPDNQKLRIPPHPHDGQHGNPLTQVEYPYCGILKYIPIEPARAWESHVLRDLQPYVCTFDGCDMFDHMFSSREDCFNHEFALHRGQWSCNTCEPEGDDGRRHGGHVLFSRLDEFMCHMNETHSMVESKITLTLDSFRLPVSVVNGECCLCKRHAQKLKSHLGRHLEQMALFSLPRPPPAASSGSQVVQPEGPQSGSGDGESDGPSGSSYSGSDQQVTEAIFREAFAAAMDELSNSKYSDNAVPCPFYIRYPEACLQDSVCVGGTWSDVRSMRCHLYDHHALRYADASISDRPLEVFTITGEQDELLDVEIINGERSDLSEEDKWHQIYQILFPSAPKPVLNWLVLPDYDDTESEKYWDGLWAQIKPEVAEARAAMRDSEAADGSGEDLLDLESDSHASLDVEEGPMSLSRNAASILQVLVGFSSFRHRRRQAILPPVEGNLKWVFD